MREEWREGSGQVPFLRAERAHSESARSMRAVKGSLARSLQYWGRGIEEERGLAIPCARATRGRRLPSLEARTMGKRQATPHDCAEREKWWTRTQAGTGQA